jgi:hypothetical protein
MEIAQDLISDGSIKYIVIPIRDISNNDDFFQSYGNDRNFYTNAISGLPYLHKLNTNFDGLMVYENDSSHPYISASQDLVNTGGISNINQIYSFDTNELNISNFKFTVGPSSSPSTNIEDAFSNITSKNLKNGVITTPDKARKDGKSILYVNVNRSTLSYKSNGKNIAIFKSSENKLYVNGHAMGNNTTPQSILSEPLETNHQYYISQDNNLTSIASQQSGYLSVATSANINLLADNGNNLIANSSFQKGLWQKKVGDCNNYDDNPQIGMKLNTSNQPRALQLLAGRHTACTGPRPLSITPGGYYKLSFNYETKNSDRLSYTLAYGGGNTTKLTKQIQIKDQDTWATYSTLIHAPNDARTLSVQLLGYPNEQLTKLGITNYSSLSLTPLQLVASTPVNTKPSFVKLPINSNDKITYEDNKFKLTNLIPNGSFQKGLWQKKVGDCNNYDDNPQIGMKLDKIGAQNVLELDAKRHIACTGPQQAINIVPNTKVLLSFSYQSPNGTNAGYYVRFNDPAHTIVSKQLSIANTGWNTYSNILTVPSDATQMSLGVDSYAASPTSKTIITRYSKFEMYTIPDIQNSYFIVNSPLRSIVPPKFVNYHISNPTKRIVHITGATGPFYLNMSEAYSNKWRLEINNNKVHGLSSLFPINSPDAINTNYHYKLDDYSNGWYVDTTQLCTKEHLCQRGADGSYNINLEIEYTPERWFNLGLLISCATLLTITSYLGGHYYKRHKQKAGEGHYVASRQH